MKKHLLAGLMACSMVLGLVACGTTSTPAASTTTKTEEAVAAETQSGTAEVAGTWAPTDEVKFIVCSSAGGGSDIYTREMIDIINNDGISADTNFVVDYMTDGGGESGRQYVADAKKADNLLVAMEYGGFANMLLNTSYRIENFRPIAVVAEECQVLLAQPTGKYENFEAAVEAAKGGTVVSIAGSGQADDQMYQYLRDAAGLTDAQLTYVRCSSTSDAITDTMGGHSDFVFARPSACVEYVESKDLTPVLACQEDRFKGNLDCETVVEAGYGEIKVPLWRGVCGPKNMSDDAYEFYCDIFKKMAESDRWKDEYCAKYQANLIQAVGEDAVKYMTDSQDAYLAANGK